MSHRVVIRMSTDAFFYSDEELSDVFGAYSWIAQGASIIST